MADPPPEDRLQRLDPDLAATTARGARDGPAGRPAAPPRSGFTPHRLQWLAGALALIVVVAFSAYELTSRGTGTAGIPAGKAVRMFAAPLANSNLVGDANLAPPCSTAHHDPRALNVCLLLQRGPLVLGFFVTDSSGCERAVDAMQSVSAAWTARGVQFAAIAVRADRGATAAAARKHGWTIPVAYDRDGAVGASYGVEVCPLVELIRRGGVVATRLIGDRWTKPAALSAQIAVLTKP
jgi:peroxiredoxin